MIDQRWSALKNHYVRHKWTRVKTFIAHAQKEWRRSKKIIRNSYVHDDNDITLHQILSDFV